MICRLCNQPRKLIRAHVIPEAFFRPLRANGQTPILVTGRPGRFPARVPIGVYDQTILCRSCELAFESPDSYGASVLLNQFTDLFSPIERDGRVVAYTSPKVDQSLLLRFLLTVLWRASVSTHPFYQRVALGPYESVARDYILNAGAPAPEVFGAALSRWTSHRGRAYAKAVLMDPFRERWDGANAYRFYFGETVAYIRASPRPFPSPLAEHALCAGTETVVIARDIGKSNDFKAMESTAMYSHTNGLALQRARRQHKARGGKGAA